MYLDVNRAHFDRLYADAALYGPGELWNRWQRARYVTRSRRAADRRLLEVGCGDGIVTELVAAACGDSIEGLTAIDVSRVGIDRARARGLGPQVHLACSTLEQFEPPAPFDFVYMFDVIEHLDDPGAALRTVMRFLRPGGRALLSTPNQMRLANRVRQLRRRPLALMDPTHAREFSPFEFRGMLTAEGFRVLQEWGVVLFVADWFLAFSNGENSPARTAPGGLSAPSASVEMPGHRRSLRSRVGSAAIEIALPLVRRIEQSRVNYAAGRLFPSIANATYVLVEKPL